ncbi:DUF6191 domain-containing protein [Kibdelosporangium lantanae]|uniref:DUF6191 domain-containing protein n=1 Tax=Kibdelosporangium lantanae TaxID=1497396 RepID=A0ABW3MSN9_9PSEU
MDPVETALSLGIPAPVLLLVGMAVYEMRRQKRGKGSGTPLAETYANELTAMFYGTKRMELDHRDSMSMMREEESDGAPPRAKVDLDRGVAVLRLREVEVEPDAVA